MADSSMVPAVIWYHNGEEGWSPIFELAHLAARLLGADLFVKPTAPPGPLVKLWSLRPWARAPRSGPFALVISAGPPHLIGHLSDPEMRSRYKRLIGWCIDPFWTTVIPRTVRKSRMFEHLFITSAEDVPEWRRQVGDRVSWLPWGTDTLACNGAEATRAWDVIRVGRQPPEWDDDATNSRECAAHDLTYHPRPATFLGWQANQRVLRDLYSSGKYLLAFSNSAHRTVYTHPTRQYITARWTDSLACGLVVAGIPPHEPSIDALLWPTALLPFDSTDRREGLERLVAARATWAPRVAAENRLRAMERLDWRWRLRAIVERAGIRSAPLDDEEALLKSQIADDAQRYGFAPGPTGFSFATPSAAG